MAMLDCSSTYPKDHSPAITVFTPTYNRAHTLPRVYESLSVQTFRDFEWVIVDDGSEDRTRELVDRWCAEANFPIRYEHQANRGKPSAFNRGVQLAEGALFAPIDSDDTFLPDGLATYERAWSSIPDKSGYAGIIGLCVDERGRIVGDRYPSSPLDVPYLETIYRYRVRGEKTAIFRTDVLRKFPFPENFKFVPEGVIWGRIGQEYVTRFINEPIRVYYQDSGNQVSNVRADRYPEGHALWHLTILNREIGYFRYAPKAFMRSAVHYTRFSLHTGTKSLLPAVQNPFARALVAVMFPLAYAVFQRDRIRGR